ncbi:exonuclease [Klebsiella phage vB_KpnM_KpV477]|uniref:Putative DNA exonuclease A n=1 Tax=Klebsiella phage vB_KpnM_KpV477 TaxID=1852625 RepID=A0A1B1P8M2_9CAUD|nr:exonuclease [Klebsiella phage vB_KpnM_KpV477]ANT40451.1 putative DNA exonuclease A [Klebsiella phage vB_KpnM_KpV477]QEG11648.1 putative DNA exonuclease A [Klebsiella phage KPN6]UNY40820.1 exonuclease [Klebsiella phage KP182]
MAKDFIIDFETFGNVSSSSVIDLALITFDSDPEIIESFDELVNRGHRIKFDLKSQKGHRLFGKSTLEWWKKQSAEARANLASTPDDLSVIAGIKEAQQYLIDNGIHPWDSFGWCRGQSFDFPIFVDCLRDVQRAQGISEEEIDTFKEEPCKFWNQRDIRTAIESLLLTRGLTTTPLPKGTLDGFIAHDSIHDCAKDILMLKYAQRYALGLSEAPSPEDTDPLSLPKGRG